MSEKDKIQEQEVAPAEEQENLEDYRGTSDQEMRDTLHDLNDNVVQEGEKTRGDVGSFLELQNWITVICFVLIGVMILFFGAEIKRGMARVTAMISDVEHNTVKLVRSDSERQRPATAEEEKYALLHRQLLGKQGQLTPLEGKTVGQMSDGEVNLMFVLRDDIEAVKQEKSIRASALDADFVALIDGKTTIPQVDEWLRLQNARQANRAERTEEARQAFDTSQTAGKVQSLQKTLEQYQRRALEDRQREIKDRNNLRSSLEQDLSALRESTDERLSEVSRDVDMVNTRLTGYGNRLSGVEETQTGMSGAIALIEGDILEIKATNTSQDEVLVLMDKTIQAMAPAIENARKRLDSAESKISEIEKKIDMVNVDPAWGSFEGSREVSGRVIFTQEEDGQVVVRGFSRVDCYSNGYRFFGDGKRFFFGSMGTWIPKECVRNINQNQQEGVQ